jgi:hypothetical protein
VTAVVAGCWIGTWLCDPNVAGDELSVGDSGVRVGLGAVTLRKIGIRKKHAMMKSMTVHSA